MLVILPFADATRHWSLCFASLFLFVCDPFLFPPPAARYTPKVDLGQVVLSDELKREVTTAVSDFAKPVSLARRTLFDTL